jgi:hypothetical protein
MNLTPEELASVVGGAGLSTLWNMVKSPPKPGSTGSGPQSFMDFADKPGKTLDGVKSILGMPDSGAPNSFYSPATSNGNGITPGSFSGSDGSGPQVPISE